MRRGAWIIALAAGLAVAGPVAAQARFSGTWTIASASIAPSARDPKADDAKPAEPKADEKPAAEEKPAVEKKDEEPKLDKKALEEKRKAIERENKRKQEDYDAQIKKGEDHVKELNERFADWYYVISEDVYQKIHLGRGEIVKVKEEKKEDAKPAAPGEGTKPSDFDALEKKGLN